MMKIRCERKKLKKDIYFYFFLKKYFFFTNADDEVKRRPYPLYKIEIRTTCSVGKMLCVIQFQ